MSDRPRAAVWRLFARQHSHQRRLTGAVWSDERDAIAALDVEVDVAEDAETVVGLVRMLQLEHGPAALGAVREPEVDALPFGWDLDRHDLLEQLDSALHLRRF